MAVAEWEEGVLFPEASEAEIAKTKFLLGKYKSMRLLMDDYEKHREDLEQVAIDGEVARRIDQEDLHADKTANAVILAEKRRWVYEQYRYRETALVRAYSLILSEDVKRAIQHRYFDGHSLKETCLFFGYYEKSSTIRSWVDKGIVAIANNLKLLGFFDKDAEQF
ncbi:hypothetical protein KIH86_03575 [Paenibacillus sp. HN-1]|uniref:hypothetical protein n=1 Tax=Paenibacillus TaxID=44249 RepID=UPI001CA97169|nr:MULTISPECIES: hypothetical protein [Paenibacillus]MBY9077262.1 hypothetical protein [Paenibacillus sp. CGMCC 1.18879]MBY9083309.1 hypothetical protein [Paenibacillus sinensis]